MDWRGVEVAVLEAGAGSPPLPSSVASDAPIDTNASETKRFGKSWIEISDHGRIQVAVPRAQVIFKGVDCNPQIALRLGGGYGIGSAGEMISVKHGELCILHSNK